MSPPFRQALFAGAALVVMWSPTNPMSVRAAEPSLLVQAIQQALLDYGYKPGPADGELGNNTRKAIRQFQSDFALEVTGEPTETLAAQLGLLSYAPPGQAEILVVDVASDARLVDDMVYSGEPTAVASRLQGSSHAEVVTYLHELSEASLARVVPPTKNPIGIYQGYMETIAIVEDAAAGDVVVVQREYHHERIGTIYENAFYAVDKTTPVEPLVIVNVFSGIDGARVINRVLLNGAVIAEKRTRIAR